MHIACHQAQTETPFFLSLVLYPSSSSSSFSFHLFSFLFPFPLFPSLFFLLPSLFFLSLTLFSPYPFFPYYFLSISFSVIPSSFPRILPFSYHLILLIQNSFYFSFFIFSVLLFLFSFNLSFYFQSSLFPF